jgi:hypothetical protein
MSTPIWALDPLGFSKHVNLDTLALEVDSWLQQFPGGLTNALETARNPHLSQATHDQQHSDVGLVRQGRIQYAVPYFDCYLVAMDTGEVLTCTRLLGAGSGHLFGTRDTSMLPAGSTVAVFQPTKSPHGFIMGVLPSTLKDGNYNFADWIFQGSNVGFRRQTYYRDLLRRFKACPVKDFSDHRPSDQLSFDYGVMNLLGGGLHIDPLHFFLRIDESCGIFGYYPDQSLRIVGQNLDIWSLQHVEQRRADEGELTCYYGEVTYFWEAHGGFARDVGLHKLTDAKDVLFNKPYGTLEPKEDDQTPFYRYEEYGGYLGQGHIRQMSIPPATNENEPLNTYSSTETPIGVFREHIALDGTYSLASAKQVSLSKRTLIPIPKRLRLQEDYDNEADSVANKNYKFSGEYSDGDEHKVGDLTTDDEQPHLLNAAAVLDLHAYSHNWKALHAFHYHRAADFELKQESELKPIAQAIPPFSELKDKTWLPPAPWGQPEVTTRWVDKRYGDVRYLEVLSHITLDEYGNVVIQGGSGEEIRMAGGNIQISCPGNIICQSGKSTVTLAGRDAVIRAKNSVDVTASDHDVRVKAERNLQMLSGNSGIGGMLLENRSQSTEHNYPAEGGEQISGTGITLKAPGSSISTMSQGAYIRTGSAEGGVGSGDIVLDADQGRSNIRATAASYFRYLASEAVDSFGMPTAFTANTSGIGGLRVGGRLDVAGDVRGAAGAAFMNNVYAVTGHYYSAIGGEVNRILDISRQRGILASEVTAPAAKDLTEAKSGYEKSISKAFYADDKIGSPEIQQAISFSLRTEDEYGTTAFVLPQTHWQMLAEVDSSGTEIWDESVVVYQGVEQMPWPGYENWTDRETLLRLPPDSHTLYDIKNGYSRDRSEDAYESGDLGTFVASVPQKTYRVIES